MSIPHMRSNILLEMVCVFNKSYGIRQIWLVIDRFRTKCICVYYRYFFPFVDFEYGAKSSFITLSPKSTLYLPALLLPPNAVEG